MVYAVFQTCQGVSGGFFTTVDFGVALRFIVFPCCSKRCFFAHEVSLCSFFTLLTSSGTVRLESYGNLWRTGEAVVWVQVVNGHQKNLHGISIQTKTAPDVQRDAFLFMELVGCSWRWR